MMLTYIAIILTIHTLVGIIAAVLAIVNNAQHIKMAQAEIEKRNRFFDEIAKQIKEDKSV